MQALGSCGERLPVFPTEGSASSVFFSIRETAAEAAFDGGDVEDEESPFDFDLQINNMYI